jgi:hypothetical protein
MSEDFYIKEKPCGCKVIMCKGHREKRNKKLMNRYYENHDHCLSLASNWRKNNPDKVLKHFCDTSVKRWCKRNNLKFEELPTWLLELRQAFYYLNREIQLQSKGAKNGVKN